MQDRDWSSDVCSSDLVLIPSSPSSITESVSLPYKSSAANNTTRMVWSHALYGCITGGTDELRMQCMFPDTLRTHYVSIRTASVCQSLCKALGTIVEVSQVVVKRQHQCTVRTPHITTLTPVSYPCRRKRQTACHTCLFHIDSIRMYMYSCLHSLVQKMVNFDKCIYTTR